MPNLQNVEATNQIAHTEHQPSTGAYAGIAQSAWSPSTSKILGCVDVAEQVAIGGIKSLYKEVTEHPGRLLLHAAEGVAVGAAVVAAAPLAGALGAGATVLGGIEIATNVALVGAGAVGAAHTISETIDAGKNSSSAIDVVMDQSQHTKAEVEQARLQIQERTGAAAVDVATTIATIPAGLLSGARIASLASSTSRTVIAAGASSMRNSGALLPASAIADCSASTRAGAASAAADVTAGLNDSISAMVAKPNIIGGGGIGKIDFVPMSDQATIDQAVAKVLASPRALVSALPRLRDTFAQHGDYDLSHRMSELCTELTPQNPIAKIKVDRLLGSGVTQITFGTEYDTALKLGNGHITRLTPHPAFDAPVLGAGKIGDNYNYYMQPIGDTSRVRLKDVETVSKQIISNGFHAFDMRREQVAFFGKRPLLIDQECAQLKYGTTWQDGRFVVNETQVKTLNAVKDYLHSKNISLADAARNEDLALELGKHLRKIGAKPTMLDYFSEQEAELALRSLIGK